MCEMGTRLMPTRLETISSRRFKFLVSICYKSGCVQESDYQAWLRCLTKYRFYFVQPLTLFLQTNYTMQ